MTDSPGQLRMPVVPGLSDLSVLARGGYATVFRAVQDFVGREVAVKVENRTLDSERDQRRFLREARAAGRMSSHPYVVDLYDAGVTADQHPYLIMELCDGSYADRMRDSPLSPAEAREIGVKIADALADAHQLGVLHRDVKPANILVSRFGEPNLADFGLAILAETRDSSVTLEVLTPAYAPPEMFRHSAPSPAVDVYALCATLYAVMRGKPPRWRDDRSPSLITLMELFAEPIPDLPGVPREMMDVLRVGMANDPATRPSAEELRDMLAAVQLGPARPSGPARPTGGGVGSASPLVSPGPGAAGGLGGAGGLGAAAGGLAAGGMGAAAGGAVVPGAGSVSPGRPAAGSVSPESHAVGSVSPAASPAYPSAGSASPVSGGRTPGGSGSGAPAPGGSLYGRPVGGAPLDADDAGQASPWPRRAEPPFGLGEWTPGHDTTPTVRNKRRRQRLGWLAGGIGMLVLLSGVALSAWVVLTPEPGGSPSPQASGERTEEPTRTPRGTPDRTPTRIGFALPGCLALLPDQGRCPDELECYSALTKSQGVLTAEAVSCTGRHTWEAFAVGELPATADPRKAESDDGVRELCSEGSFRVISLRLEKGWKFGVLPPSRADFEAGDRTYRCLAGRGEDGLDGPTLIRRGG